MKVRVKFFAILRERAGTAEVTQELSDGATVGDLWHGLQKTPAFPHTAYFLLRSGHPGLYRGTRHANSAANALTDPV